MLQDDSYRWTIKFVHVEYIPVNDYKPNYTQPIED